MLLYLLDPEFYDCKSFIFLPLKIKNYIQSLLYIIGLALISMDLDMPTYTLEMTHDTLQNMGKNLFIFPLKEILPH